MKAEDPFAVKQVRYLCVAMQTCCIVTVYSILYFQLCMCQSMLTCSVHIDTHSIHLTRYMYISQLDTVVMRIIPVTFAIATRVSHGDRGLDRLWRGIFSLPHWNCICTFFWAASVEKQTTLLLTLASKFLHIWAPSSANVIKSSSQTCDVRWAQYRYGNNVRI